MTDEIELLHLSLELPCTTTINLICIYRPPGSNVKEFLDLLQHFLNNINYLRQPLFLIGDFYIYTTKVCSINLYVVKKVQIKPLYYTPLAHMGLSCNPAIILE